MFRILTKKIVRYDEVMQLATIDVDQLTVTIDLAGENKRVGHLSERTDTAENPGSPECLVVLERCRFIAGEAIQQSRPPFCPWIDKVDTLVLGDKDTDGEQLID
jgi:hypothetical protein